MIHNTIKSEQPLIGKGLLYSEKEEEAVLTPEKQIQKEELIEGHVRKSWGYREVLDQGKQSNNVGCAWTAYLSTVSPMPSLEMEDKLFARSLYETSQTMDPWEGTEEEGKYGTSLITAGLVLKGQEMINDIIWTKDVNILANYILSSGAAIVASPWKTEMSRVDPNGFVRPNGHYEGNHCWLVYGVDDIWETFFALNSWGKDFGKDGKFLVKFSDMKRILQDGFALASI
jgi:hypothetical protein